MARRDRYVHWLANRVLQLGSKQYRQNLNDYLTMGQFVFNDEELFDLALDKVIEARYNK